MAKTKVLICPYCGETQPAGERCRACGGLFDALSRQATHNAMGPWFIRDDNRPFHPGCSYETLVKLVDRGMVDRYTLLRGPTTRQYWTVAKHVPGISHLLGYCHNCDASVDPGDHGCHACGVPFGAYLDRNYMGLPDVKPLPWESEESDGAEEGAIRGVVTWADDASTPQPRQARISSFATDEELLQPSAPNGGSASSPTKTSTPTATPAAPAPAAAAPVALAPATPFAPAPAPAPAATPAPAETTEPFATHPVARSMRRRIERQQRTIRLLASIAILLGVVLVLTNTSRVLEMMGGNGRPNTSSPNTTPGTDDAAGVTGDANDNAASTAEEPVTDQDATGDETTTPPKTSIGDDLEAPAIAAPDDPVDPVDDTLTKQLTDARELLGKARDQSRDAEARLADARAALEMLRAVADDPDIAPALASQLVKELSDTEELVRNLETILFFDDG